MIKQLWSICMINDETSNSALIALSHFDRSYFKCSHLPEFVYFYYYDYCNFLINF
jgi:hypothetical protein